MISLAGHGLLTIRVVLVHQVVFDVGSVRGLGVVAILVGAFVAVLHQEHEQHDGTNERDDRNEQPLARAVGIVQAADGHRQARHKDG